MVPVVKVVWFIYVYMVPVVLEYFQLTHGSIVSVMADTHYTVKYTW